MIQQFLAASLRDEHCKNLIAVIEIYNLDL